TTTTATSTPATSPVGWTSSRSMIPRRTPPRRSRWTCSTSRPRCRTASDVPGAVAPRRAGGARRRDAGRGRRRSGVEVGRGALGEHPHGLGGDRAGRGGQGRVVDHADRLDVAGGGGEERLLGLVKRRQRHVLLGAA